MRRAPIVIAATVFGTAAVLGLQTRPPALSGSPAPTAAGSSGAAGSSSTTTTTTSPTTASTPTTTSKPATTPAPAPTKTVLGDPISTQYGIAQVRVTVANGKITKIEAVQLQDSDPKSVQISSYAAPILQQSALSKQTANIDAVSGATYTSGSYKASLQSALDRAGFKAADGARASTNTSALNG